MEVLNGLNLEGQCIEICLAKPQDKKLKEKKLERQMQKQMALRLDNSQNMISLFLFYELL